MHEDYKPLIVRYSDPHKYDQAPYGTYCKVLIAEKGYKIFKQNSKNEEEPLWELVEIYHSK